MTFREIFPLAVENGIVIPLHWILMLASSARFSPIIRSRPETTRGSPRATPSILLVILAFQATGNVVGQFADGITDTFIVSLLLHQEFLRNEPGGGAVGGDHDIAHPVPGNTDDARDIRIYRGDTFFDLPVISSIPI